MGFFFPVSCFEKGWKLENGDERHGVFFVLLCVCVFLLLLLFCFVECDIFVFGCTVCVEFGVDLGRDGVVERRKGGAVRGRK